MELMDMFVKERYAVIVQTEELLIWRDVCLVASLHSEEKKWITHLCKDVMVLILLNYQAGFKTCRGHF